MARKSQARVAVGETPFSGLPLASTITPADVIALVQGGVSMRSPVSQLWDPTAVGNANYTILTTDVMVYTSVAFTAARTWSLPLAASYGAGRILRVVDSLRTLTVTNTLTLLRQGSDTINAGTSKTYSDAGQAILLICDGASAWTVLSLGVLPSAATAGNSYQALSLSAGGNTNSSQSAPQHFINAAVAAGSSGAYVATISLLASGRSAGDCASLSFTIAASTNPKIQVFDNSTAGTKIFEWQADGNATSLLVVAVFNGTNWYLHDAHFIG